MDLQADSVQGVLFLTPGQQQDDALKLWDHLFPGVGPDAFQRANPVPPSPFLMSTASGERQGRYVTINAQNGRIDIVINQPPLAAPTGGAIPRIADIPAAAEAMASLLKKTAERVAILRIALVVDLSKTIAPGAESSELLKLVPAFPFPANVTDLSLQYNSRKRFTCSSVIEMNRLCIWTTGKVGFLQNSMIPGSPMMVMAPVVGLKIDINSAPEARFSSDMVVSIIDEIREESVLVYTDGMQRTES